LVVDLAGARLTLAVAEGAVAWVEKEAAVQEPAVAEAVVQEPAVAAVMAVAVAVGAEVVVVEEDDDDKRTHQSRKTNENKINNYDVVENFSYYVCDLYFWVARPHLACGQAGPTGCGFAAKTKGIRHTATGCR